MTLYFEVSRLAAQLAPAEDEVRRHELERRFWELYRGPLCIVEDTRVEPYPDVFES